MGGGTKDDNMSDKLAKMDKATVIQECRVFNESPLNGRKCRTVLCKLLYLIRRGEKIEQAQATEAFFAITKLFQCEDKTLRLLVYLAIKELCVMSGGALIVISSLTKDMTNYGNINRAGAIRALCHIIDPEMLQTVERYMKQALVDKTAAVSSAALVSSLHLMRKAPDVVRRWVNVVQEAVSHDDHMVQYLALALLYQIRSDDHLSVTRLFHKFASGLRSPLAICYLIRIAAKLIISLDDSKETRIPLSFILQCFLHRNEIVRYEAALVLIRLPVITSSHVASAVSVLQILCSSPKPSLRFVAVRTLNQIAMIHPQAVVCCNIDLEELINDQNRSIAVFAVITLLKTSSESAVERLMKQISSFVTQIEDDFKVAVVESIRLTCARCPGKHETMMIFLTSMLRGEGSFTYKKTLTDTIIAIIEQSPALMESGLSEMCEFIEDCEYVALTIRVLHMLGREGPTTPYPERFIRFIYNRIFLEAIQVRAAAITTLAKFGASCQKLRSCVEVLLKRCLLDSDDEVRDRATFYLGLMRNGQPKALSNYILDALKVSDVGLEKALNQYVIAKSYGKPFDLNEVPVTSESATIAERARTSVVVEKPLMLARKGTPHTKSEDVAPKLAEIMELGELGTLFRSVPPVVLSESVAEYNVSCTKHIFPNHIVLQFDCRNTMNDQLLENISVDLNLEDESCKILKAFPLTSLPYDQEGSIFLLLEMVSGERVFGSFVAALKFQVHDVDPDTGEPDPDNVFEDTYAINDLVITLADYIKPVVKENFSVEWEKLGGQNEHEAVYFLSALHTLQDAVEQLHECLGLAPCENSDKVPKEGYTHTLLMSGVFHGGYDALVKIRMVLNPVERHVTVNIVVRSNSADLSEMICVAIE